MKRLYVSSKIKNILLIEKLQEKVNTVCPLKLIPTELLHVTIFHYGIPEKLYEEVRILNPALSFEAFLAALHVAVTPLSLEKAREFTILGHEILLASDGLDIFGDAKSPVVVLRLEKSKELTAFWQSLLLQAESFLLNCGIADTNSFFEASANLKYSYNYNPHITLGMPRDTHQSISSLSIETIRVDLYKPQLSVQI